MVNFDFGTGWTWTGFGVSTGIIKQCRWLHVVVPSLVVSPYVNTMLLHRMYVLVSSVPYVAIEGTYAA